MRPFGAFVHHQGRGHAERIAALAHALPAGRKLTLFCARDDIFPPLPPRVEIRRIPSLFEAECVAPPALDDQPTPATLHCAPLGWPQITRAMSAMLAWMADARPALFVVDVSAEVAQLCRIASVPHVKVLQHGTRGDAGHLAAYEGAVGLLAPYAEALEQPERPAWLRNKTFHAPGIGVPASPALDRAAARARLGLPPDARIIVALSGGGGEGLPLAPLAVGARALPEALWLAVGHVAAEWHATVPGNLHRVGWTATPELYLLAADLVVGSAGNTAVHLVLRAGRPFVVVPEWRYFDEQLEKARALSRAGVAACREHWPGHAEAWRVALAEAEASDPAGQRALSPEDGAARAADWLEHLARRLWQRSPTPQQPERIATP